MKRFFCLTLILILSLSCTIFLFDNHTQTAFAEEIRYGEVEDILYNGSIVQGGTPLTTDEVRIDYSYKVEEEYVNPYKLPKYLSSYTCGITAGGVIIGHYDRIYEELIPNHTGSIFSQTYLYGTQGTEVNNMFTSLYNLMGATSAGVTLNGYINGMKSYVSGKGRTASLTSVKSGSTLNATQYKAALDQGKLLTLFVQDFSVIELSSFRTYDGYDTVKAYLYTGAHIMAVYGYLNVYYYNSNNQCFRTDSYLYVHSGASSATLALTKLNQYCAIDNCYITYIY